MYSSHVDAWLNIVVLDEQLNPVMTNDGNNSYYEQVGNPSTANVKQYNVSRPITKSGYVYIYVSNETPNVATYWDDLQVTHLKGHLLQENSYYPFGLEMKALSSQAALKPQTTYKYNAGTNLESDFDVDYYETPARNYDPQVGRFTGIDGMSEQTMSMTTYQFGGNNPISFNDPSGLLKQYQQKPDRSINININPYDMPIDLFNQIDGINQGWDDMLWAAWEQSSSGGGGGGGGGASSAGDIFSQVLQVAQNGISDIVDENGNSLAAARWNFSDGYLTSMVTIANDYNSANLFTESGEFSISFNQSEFQNASYNDPDGPRITPSSFNFTSTGKNSNTRNAKVWGINAGYYVDDELVREITFGLNIYASIDVKNWNTIDRMASLLTYSQLWFDEDIQTKVVDGVTHYIFSTYAQQIISAGATNYAAMWANERDLLLPAGLGVLEYKTQFMEYWSEWAKKYMPGTSAIILNKNVPGTTEAKFIP